MMNGLDVMPRIFITSKNSRGMPLVVGDLVLRNVTVKDGRATRAYYIYEPMQGTHDWYPNELIQEAVDANGYLGHLKSLGHTITLHMLPKAEQRQMMFQDLIPDEQPGFLKTQFRYTYDITDLALRELMGIDTETHNLVIVTFNQGE